MTGAYVPGGHVVGAHGVHGALRVALDVPWGSLSPAPGSLELGVRAAALARLAAHDPQLAARAVGGGPDGARLPLRVAHARAQPAGALLHFEGLSVREAAMTLAGARLAVPRACLPPCEDGEFWCFELAEMTARDEAGALLGKVVEVVQGGPQVLATVRGVDGREALVPVVDAVVRRVDRATGTVTLRVPEGLWELTAQPARSAGGGRR